MFINQVPAGRYSRIIRHNPPLVFDGVSASTPLHCYMLLKRRLLQLFHPL